MIWRNIFSVSVNFHYCVTRAHTNQSIWRNFSLTGHLNSAWRKNRIRQFHEKFHFVNRNQIFVFNLRLLLITLTTIANLQARWYFSASAQSNKPTLPQIQKLKPHIPKQYGENKLWTSCCTWHPERITIILMGYTYLLFPPSKVRFDPLKLGRKGGWTHSVEIWKFFFYSDFTWNQFL